MGAATQEFAGIEFATADGKEAKVTYVTSALNQQETQALVDYLYDQMLEIAGVPGRDSASGGNTGAAILLSNGWQLAETMAKTMEPIFAASEMEMLDIIIIDSYAGTLITHHTQLHRISYIQRRLVDERM